MQFLGLGQSTVNGKPMHYLEHHIVPTKVSYLLKEIKLLFLWADLFVEHLMARVNQTPHEPKDFRSLQVVEELWANNGRLGHIISVPGLLVDGVPVPSSRNAVPAQGHTTWESD
ncbi:hypothetical protein ACFFLM_22395 [Deinococcus oregonensis]|uniref:Uncharacterized protein n=1 Tax=Deinococcus oregonensis TaxID=1805970 RepID=A0ABV6B4N1_9DEIO